jgi:hypothetical protein
VWWLGTIPIENTISRPPNDLVASTDGIPQTPLYPRISPTERERREHFICDLVVSAQLPIRSDPVVGLSKFATGVVSDAGAFWDWRENGASPPLSSCMSNIESNRQLPILQPANPTYRSGGNLLHCRSPLSPGPLSASIAWELNASRRRPAFSYHLKSSVDDGKPIVRDTELFDPCELLPGGPLQGNNSIDAYARRGAHKLLLTANDRSSRVLA